MSDVYNVLMPKNKVHNDSFISVYCAHKIFNNQFSANKFYVVIILQDKWYKICISIQIDFKFGHYILTGYICVIYICIKAVILYRIICENML